MNVFKDGKLLGPKRVTGDWSTEVKLEKDGQLTFSTRNMAGGESWSVSFNPGEVEMMINRAQQADEKTYDELAESLNRHLEELKKSVPDEKLAREVDRRVEELKKRRQVLHDASNDSSPTRSPANEA